MFDSSFRRRRLLRLLPTANRFRELLFYLRKLRDSATSVSASKYISKMHEALTVVMSQSFEEEYRKTADLLGKYLKSNSVFVGKILLKFCLFV